ncbi:type III-B CRISPR-associated protein Cas10/Cmr2 [Kamptonema animale CS-326]|jgi:CRISPR-associated protein Cmr2|uniref:Cas10/Cmr2 second palm domain-containing protein n=1 Tax=Kamptonema animale TaxID=92934 RepID=UPI002330F706|nr:type III-B CRISPR-associated protein Cas10/Cmr2 [Kamptonema animale]MDB9510890.1 type III-B CRISPR-associated protein Cas10/Cmr2 [Kamptonema animale CS-326]
MSEYTAISFAPVQGFIEKSRKLRDLFGASLILSYLSFKLVQKAESLELEVISPGCANIQKGMPNRILIKGKFERNDVQNTLLGEWQKILTICREWIEDNLGIPKCQYCWSQTEDQKGKQKGEWERWGSYTWEIFWGYGESVEKAMDDLETRKLKRDWVGVNWSGESSSLTGTDAIAWHQLGKKDNQPGRSLTQAEKEELELFYRRLSWLLDNPDYRVGKPCLSLAQLRQYENDKPDDFGKYIAPNEQLSIPELVKRLVTYDKIADDIGMEKLKKKKDDPEFKDIYREAGYWTGWFMGDGDKVGDKLQDLASRHQDNPEQRDRDLKLFTELMRKWGKNFEEKKDLFTQGKGRVIYAGGDDFLGVLYSEENNANEKPKKIKPIQILNWLLDLKDQWKDLTKTIEDELNLKNDRRLTFSVGFIWAGHQVPQRDVLQHCREAEKRAKSLGRDRITIRVVFNSGQFVQWTCPWDYLDILTKYRDRDGNTGEQANWTHIYNDWAQLKSRHAIRLKEKENEGLSVQKTIALALFDLYFNDAGKTFTQDRLWDDIAGKNTSDTILNWLNDLIQVGWQLCRNSNI